jgi:hypothetical protein
MRLASIVCLLAAVLTFGRPAAAQELASARPIKGVLELFTSQGCSSCPPADALLKSYGDSDEVIALSLPVDYWDYLGWKDTLASSKFSERQRAYARRRGDGAVYTPQVIVNGTAHVVGSDRGQIERALAADQARFSAGQVPVRFWLRGGTIVIETGPAPDGTQIKDATIWLAVVQKRAEVQIQKGENRGKTVVYTNVVRELAPVGMYSGAPTVIRLVRHAIMRPETEACAVLIQQGEAGPIIGAAWMGP